LIVLISIVAVLSGFIIAMILTARKNAREGRRRAIEYWRNNQQYSRIGKWRRIGIEWDIERKKPVKVQFD